MDELRIVIREALPTNAEDFAELVLMSAPSLFPTIYGDGVGGIMQHLFCRRSKLKSFEHTYFAELGGRKAGMVLGYNWQVKRNEDWRTGFHPQQRGFAPLYSQLSNDRLIIVWQWLQGGELTWRNKKRLPAKSLR